MDQNDTHQAAFARFTHPVSRHQYCTAIVAFNFNSKLCSECALWPTHPPVIVTLITR